MLVAVGPASGVVMWNKYHNGVKLVALSAVALGLVALCLAIRSGDRTADIGRGAVPVEVRTYAGDLDTVAPHDGRGVPDASKYSNTIAERECATALVRSASGIEIHDAVWRPADGETLRVFRKQSGFHLSHEGRPGILEVPGHTAVSVTGAERDIVVNPDALISIAYPRLKSIVHAVVLNEPKSSVIEHAALSGFVGTDGWSVAIDSDYWAKERLAPLRYDLELVSGAHVLITIKPRPALRASLFPTLDGATARSTRKDLHLDIKPYEAMSPGRTVRVEVTSDTELGNTPTTLQDERFEWGRLMVVTQGGDSRTVVATESVVTLPELPLGAYIATAIVEQTGAYARGAFFHDGSDRSLNLKAGARIVGIIQCIGIDSSAVSLSWQLSDSPAVFEDGEWPAQSATWFGRVDKPTLSSTGSFSFNVPQRVPSDASGALPLPVWLQVTATAPSSPAVSVVISAQKPGEYDVGVIVLEGNAPQLRILGGGGLAAANMSERGLRVWLSTPLVELTVDRATLSDDGTVHLYPVLDPKCGPQCVRARDMLTGKPIQFEWAGIAPQAIAVERTTEDALCFVAAGPLRFSPVESSPTVVDLRVQQIPEGEEQLECGWGWRGILVPLFSGRNSTVPFKAPYVLHLPTDEVMGWWRTIDDKANISPVSSVRLQPADDGRVTLSVPW